MAPWPSVAIIKCDTDLQATCRHFVVPHSMVATVVRAVEPEGDPIGLLERPWSMMHRDIDDLVELIGTADQTVESLRTIQ
ncbi:MAG: hypothetical protein RLP98_11400 [Devosia sp.]